MDRSVGILDRPIVDSAAHDGASARLADRRGRRSPSGTGRAAHEQRLIRIGLLLPISGSSGMHGPPGRSCAQLAVGRDQRPWRLARPAGPGCRRGRRHVLRRLGPGRRAADRGRRRRRRDRHPSERRARNPGPKIGRRVPYVYTPIFEGDGYEPGVFYLGETAYQQLGPVLPWMKAHLGIRRWYLIGNDFRWPRDVHRMARRLLAEQQGVLAGDRLVPLETEDFDAIVAEIRALRPDALIVTLVGSDAVIFPPGLYPRRPGRPDLAPGLADGRKHRSRHRAPNAAVGCCRARPILRACPTPRTRTSCNATGAASVRTRRC